MDIVAMLQHVLEKKASDLILTSGVRPHVRVHGVLEPIPESAELDAAAITGHLSRVLTKEQLESLHEERELDVSFGIKGISRFRLNAYFQRGCPGAAIRLIPFDIPEIDELGLPAATRRLVEKHYGLILVTGRTGSGKSTTLAALIEHLNRTRHCHIVTIEDPIEFIYSHKKSIIDQREVGTDTGSFTSALKRVLRQTPDVIMIGEMRDLDTIQSALTLAETGHLILGTLHTHSAANSVHRIVDVFPPEQQQQVRFQLSEVLLGVLSQSLLPRKNGNGLALATEIMTATNAVKNLIRENTIHRINSVIQTSSEHGMHSLNLCLCRLVREGVIDEAVALLHSNEPSELRTILQQDPLSA